MSTATMVLGGATDELVIDLTSPVHKDKSVLDLSPKEHKELVRHLSKLEKARRKAARKALDEASATSNPVAIIQIDPADIVTPCDKHGRTIGQYTVHSIEQLHRFLEATAKNHGHRTAPLKKRGDVAKRRRIAAAHARDIDVRITKGDLYDQLDELHQPDECSPIEHAFVLPAEPKFLAHAC